MFEFGDTDTDREITDAFNKLPTVERAPWFLNLEAAARALAEVVVNYDLATAMDGLVTTLPAKAGSFSEHACGNPLRFVLTAQSKPFQRE